MTFTDVWAIVWGYHDGSGYGVVRVHEREELAERDLKMLQEHSNGSMRRYEIQKVHLVKNRQEKKHGEKKADNNG